MCSGRCFELSLGPAPNRAEVMLSRTRTQNAALARAHTNPAKTSDPLALSCPLHIPLCSFSTSQGLEAVTDCKPQGRGVRLRWEGAGLCQLPTDLCPPLWLRCDFSWGWAAQTWPCWRHSWGPGGWMLSLLPLVPREAPSVDAPLAFPRHASS